MAYLTKVFLKDFESVYTDEITSEKYRLIKGAYCFSIIITLGKILSKSRNESFSLKCISKKFPQFSERIDLLFRNHSMLIEKIRNNRDKIFAHTDKDFSEMGFSKLYVEKLKQRHDIDFIELLAKNKDDERYTASDLYNDIPEIMTVLNVVENIINESRKLIKI